MHGLIALLVGYTIYLLLFFHAKKRNRLSREIAVILAVKLVILFSLYFLFFSHPPSKEERRDDVQKLILTEE